MADADAGRNIVEDARLGRRYLQIAVAFLVVTDILTTLAFVTTIGTERVLAQVVRLGIWLVIAWFLLKGRRWARWLLVILLLAGIIVVLPTITRRDAFDRENLVGTLLLLAMYAGYGVIARGLIYSKSVRAFFRVRDETAYPLGPPR